MPENYAPRRVVSLQPSVTVTLRDLGLLHKLAACTRYCADLCPEVKQAGCLIVEDSWSAKEEQIRRCPARPGDRLSALPPGIRGGDHEGRRAFSGAAPHSLKDVYRDILMIARIAGSDTPGESEQRGLEVVDRMQQEMEAVRRKTSAAGRPLVYCEEWGKPLILSQPWVAELVEIAGGRFFGEPGKHTTDEQVIAAIPGWLWRPGAAQATACPWKRSSRAPAGKTPRLPAAAGCTASTTNS